MEQNTEKNMEYVLDNIGAIVLNYSNLMKSFKKKAYEEAFKNYQKEAEEVLVALDELCKDKEDFSEDVQKAVDRLISDIDASCEGLNKSNAGNKLENYKMVMALYTVPMIQEQKLTISEMFADKLVESWSETHPKYVFKKGTYDSLVEGFYKKGFCYITTAVCENKNRADDCYELMMFRGFRDEVLLKNDEGKKLVDRYYELAPRILAAIEQKENSTEIYDEIWNKYLKDCLFYIESGKNDSCKNLYESMVLNLEKQYLS